MWLLGRNRDCDRCDDRGDSSDSGDSGTPVGHGAESPIIGRSRDVIDDLWRYDFRIDDRDDVGRLAAGRLLCAAGPLEVASPGTLIWAERVEGIDLNPPATIWRMLYHSRNGQDQDIAVSGFALVPTSPAPEGERPVYAWAHGTVGLGDQCAPSHEIRDNLPPYGGQQVERGAVLVATDYEGVGTPGLPTNGDGDGEGRAVLDSIRAVSSLPDVGAIGDVVLAGHSQGGAAVLWASEIAASYAPELDVVGAVSLAPGAELPALADAIVASPYKGIVLIGAIGLRTTHPDLDLSRVLTRMDLPASPNVSTTPSKESPSQRATWCRELRAAIPNRRVCSRKNRRDRRRSGCR